LKLWNFQGTQKQKEEEWGWPAKATTSEVGNDREMGVVFNKKKKKKKKKSVYFSVFFHFSVSNNSVIYSFIYLGIRVRKKLE